MPRAPLLSKFKACRSYRRHCPKTSILLKGQDLEISARSVLSNMQQARGPGLYSQEQKQKKKEKKRGVSKQSVNR